MIVFLDTASFSKLLFGNSTSWKSYSNIFGETSLSSTAYEGTPVVKLDDCRDRRLWIIHPVSNKSVPSEEKVKQLLGIQKRQVQQALLVSAMMDKMLTSKSTREHRWRWGNGERLSLCEFWNEFYDQSAAGDAFNIPFIRQDLGRQKQECVSWRIIFG